MKRGLLPFVLFLLSGCGTTAFHPYVGQQHNWPTSPGAFAKPGTAIPVYHGWPPRPYIVLGFVDAAQGRSRFAPGVIELAVEKAMELGADAIVVRSRFTDYGGNYHGSSYSKAGYRSKATVLAIKWRSGAKASRSGLRRQKSDGTAHNLF